MLHHIGKFDPLAQPCCACLPEPEQLLEDHSGREEWAIVEQYRTQLLAFRVDLGDIRLQDAISAYPQNIEPAILYCLRVWRQVSTVEAGRTQDLTFAIRHGRNVGPSKPRLPLVMAKDYQPPLVPPTQKPGRSIAEMQTDLDAGGVKAIALRATLRANPQWGIEIVGQKIQKVEEFLCV